jgi:two-component system phosphate regulon response regulator PhoB
MVGRSILIVDDEGPIREMIAVALEMAGYDCLEAENSQQAHAIIVDRKPDLILLDWMLPGTSGIELARRLKRDELTGDIPIIMLTAKGEEDNKIQGLEVGADDYITKPFSPRELVARLKAVLRRAGPTDGEAPIEVGAAVLARALPVEGILLRGGELGQLRVGRLALIGFGDYHRGHRV